MTPNQTKLFCTHAPYYQKGCIVCSSRYVKMLRPSRGKQDAYLAGLPAREAEQVKEMLIQERAQ